jgi:uncharacterized protein
MNIPSPRCRAYGSWCVPSLYLSFLAVTAVAQPAQPPPAPAVENPGIPGKGIVGSWLGTLKIGAIGLRIALEVREADGALTAELTSIDQNNAKIPVTTITADDAGARFESTPIRLVYEGRYSADGAQLVGTSTQNGNPLPLTFARQSKPFALNRPQEPRKPYPYQEEEVSFAGGTSDVKLAGTLTLPQGKGPFPAVVLMTGSGPQDRDEALMGHKPFLVLADHLTRAGIAVLRYDDRGFGKSTGNYAAATHFDFAADGRAAFKYLKTRPQIDGRRIGLLGHSEGSVYAPYIARDEKDVAFVVLLAGVGVPMKELLFQQSIDIMRASGVQYEFTAEDLADSEAIFARLAEKKLDEDTASFVREKMRASLARYPQALKDALGLNEATLEMRVRMLLTPWFAELLGYDARKELPGIRVPVLALFGGKDTQVAAAPNAAGMKAAFGKAKNRDVTLRTFPSLNHLFQHAKTGAPGEYGEIEETMAPEVLEAISTWVRKKS